MKRADFNGVDNKWNIKPVYTLDELIYGDIQFLFYAIQGWCKELSGGFTKENFELLVRQSKREEILEHIEYKVKEEEDAKN